MLVALSAVRFSTESSTWTWDWEEICGKKEAKPPTNSCESLIKRQLCEQCRHFMPVSARANSCKFASEHLCHSPNHSKTHQLVYQCQLPSSSDSPTNRLHNSCTQRISSPSVRVWLRNRLTRASPEPRENWKKNAGALLETKKRGFRRDSLFRTQIYHQIP